MYDLACGVFRYADGVEYESTAHYDLVTLTNFWSIYRLCIDSNTTTITVPRMFRDALERMWNYIAYVSDYQGYVIKSVCLPSRMCQTIMIYLSICENGSFCRDFFLSRSVIAGAYTHVLISMSMHEMTGFV
jgi:hypothetical protein